MSSTLALGAEAERAHWDAVAAKDPHSDLFSIPGVEGREAGIEACLDQIVPPLGSLLNDGKVLDLGCGPGRLTLALARRFPRATFIGVDISPSMITAARAQAKGIRNARFTVGDGRTLPRSLPGLDAAFSVLTLQHIPHKAQFSYLRDIARKLTSGGAVRLQFVTSDVDHFLSHGVSPDVMAEWCVLAGLEPEGIQTGLVDESWGWITARRP